MIRVFPRKTKWTPDDALAFIGDPPLFLPPPQHVAVSCTFTWDLAEAERLRKAWAQYYDDVHLGGPALNAIGAEFIPGQFLKPGITITSRGCVRNCPWCFVPRREGTVIRELPIRDGWILQDNNILACSKEHVRNVFKMLQRQKRGISFSGGLDSRLLTEEHAEMLRDTRLHELWFACDTDAGLDELRRVRELLHFVSLRKMRCYVMIGYRENIVQAEERLWCVYRNGFLPFAQLYQTEKRIVYAEAWTALAKKWSRPAAYRDSNEEAERYYGMLRRK